MPRHAQLDSRIEIVTPENIGFQYRIAGPFRRLPAYLIDLFIRVTATALVFIAATMAFSFIGAWGIGLGIGLLIWFVLAWFYGGLFETFWNGQTPGKRLMRLRVLTAEGQPITPTQAILRNVLRAADMMPAVALPLSMESHMFLPLHLLGLASTLMTKQYQRLGDLAAGTIVVVEDREQLLGITNVQEPAVIELAASIPPGFIAPRALAQALAAYASRRASFAPVRRFEIARTLAEPMSERLGLPRETNPDLLLCALYYRTFVGRITPPPPERAVLFPSLEAPLEEVVGGSP